jgi:hypothetical protein
LKDYVDTGDKAGLARFLTNANVQVCSRHLAAIPGVPSRRQVDDVDEEGRTALIYAVTEDKVRVVDSGKW